VVAPRASTGTSSTSRSGSATIGRCWSICGIRAIAEDAAESDPKHLLTLPHSVVGYPQLYLLDLDEHQIEISTERLEG
jgi:hypothetical protein